MMCPITKTDRIKRLIIKDGLKNGNDLHQEVVQYWFIQVLDISLEEKQEQGLGQVIYCRRGQLKGGLE